MITFFLKTIIVFCLNYYLGSRFLYAYEVNGHCSIPFVIDTEKFAKNKVYKFILPKEFRTPQEDLYGISKISIVGLVHYILFFLPVQTTYFASTLIYFKSTDIANNIFIIALNAMIVGFTLFISITILFIIIIKVKNFFDNRRKR